MNPRFFIIVLLFVIPGFISCRTVNTRQTAVVRRFAATTKEVTDVPYRIIYNYYTIKFKRRQLIPENYVTGDSEKEELDQLAENVLSRIEELKKNYLTDLKTASEIKSVYELLEIYILSLEKLSANRYAQDFERESFEMGKRMNGLANALNGSPRTRVRLSLNPGEWLSSLLTMHGRIKIKSMQHRFLREYINQADTLVQAINLNYQELQVPIMNLWFEEEKQVMRDQFKRSIAPYLHYLNRYPDSATNVVAVEFYSKINPVYYELTDEIFANQILVSRTAMLMNDLAKTHRNMKKMFNEEQNWPGVLEQVDALKETLFVLKDLFNKEGQEKFLFYKNFLMQNEESIKNIINKR